MARILHVYKFLSDPSSWILLMISYIIPTAFPLSSQELCLNKICSGCIAGSLSCQEGGLTHLPDRLTSDIQSMILIRHHFDNPILMSANFTPYSQQNVRLQRLTLRNCGIQRLQPETFRSMQSLQQLDLSQNQIKVIPKSCFAGLQLDFLRLDENPNLKLAPGAFEETTIVSLSMNQCGLTSLTYDDLSPLLLNKHLTNLDLSGNQLITLESRLESTFLHLQSLSLEQNPFNCDCQLNWLADVLQRRQVRRRTRAPLQGGDESAQDVYGLSHGGNGVITDLDLNKNTPLDGDLLKPLCRTPRRLIGRSIETLTAADFYCGTPQLQIIEVDLSRFRGDQKINDKGPYNITGETLEVTLRCRVKGSPELQVFWYRREHSSSDTLSRIESDSSPTFVRIPNIKALDDGGIELKLERPLQTNLVATRTSPQQTVDNLLCLASDSNGNTSAEVVLHWPTLFGTQMDLLSQKISSGKTDKELHEIENKSEQVGSLKRVTNELNQGWYTIIQEERDNFLFQKQFSVLEMIGAVVGTFTVTLALFIFGCCFLRMHRHHRDKVRSKILLHHTASQNSYNHPSPASENSKPPAYSSSSSRTPTSIATTVNNLPFSNTNGMAISLANQQTNGTSHIIDNGTLLGEFNGIHRFPFASYEPFSAPDLNSPTTYSDSQTYDLPQLPPVHCPPSAPLPPLPTAFMTTSSVAMSINRPEDARVPFLVSTLPCSPLNESNRNINGPILSPVLINNPNTMSAAMSAAATLNRLQHHHQQQQQQQQHQQQQHQQQHVNSSMSQHQLAAAAVVQNQLLDFVNRQSLLNQQFHDSQYNSGHNRLSTYDSPQT